MYTFLNYILNQFFCSPRIIDHLNYFVTVKELAQSMKPRGELKDSVVEIGIQSIMHNMNENSSKFIMPLRIGVICNKPPASMLSYYSLFFNSSYTCVFMPCFFRMQQIWLLNKELFRKEVKKVFHKTMQLDCKELVNFFLHCPMFLTFFPF